MSVEFGLKVSVFCPFTPTAHFHQPAMPNARNFHGAKYYTTEPKSFHQFSGKSAQICKFYVSYQTLFSTCIIMHKHFIIFALTIT